MLNNNGPIFQLRVINGQVRMAGIYYIQAVKYNAWNTLSFTVTFGNNTHAMQLNVNGKTWTCSASPMSDPSYYFKCGVYNLKGYWVPDQNELFIKDIFVYESV